MKFRFAFLKLKQMLQKINFDKIRCCRGYFYVGSGIKGRRSAEHEGFGVVILKGCLDKLAEGGAYARNAESVLKLMYGIKAVIADIQLEITVMELLWALGVCNIARFAADVAEIIIKVVGQGGIDEHIGSLLSGLVRGGGYFAYGFICGRIQHYLYTRVAL